MGHADQTLPWHRGIPDLQDCILLDLQDKCLGGQLRWQDLTTVPGTEAIGQRADTGKGTVPGPAIVCEFEEGQVFGFQGGSRHSRAGPSCSRRGLVLPMGSSVQDGTWCSSKHLRQVGLGVLQEPSAPGETWGSRSNLLLQVDPSAPGSSK